MNEPSISTRLAEIAAAARTAAEALIADSEQQFRRSIDVIEAHLQAIRSEMAS